MKRWLRMCLETQVSLPLFTIVLLAVVWGTTLHFIDSEEAASRELAAESAGELIATYEAQVARSITGIEQTLKVLQYSAERQGARGALPELQAHGLLPSGLVFIVSIVDARGEIVASNPAAASINVAQQEYFRIHQRQRSSYTYISHAMRDAANEDWHLHFTRRLEDARGEFAGVAIVEVDPAYFTSGYERRRMGEYGVLGLVGDDGVVRALRVGDRQSFGQRVDLAALQATAAGSAASSWDGVKRYTAVRQLAGLHLSVVVGLSEGEQMAGFADPVGCAGLGLGLAGRQGAPPHPPRAGNLCRRVRIEYGCLLRAARRPRQGRRGGGLQVRRHQLARRAVNRPGARRIARANPVQLDAGGAP
jgi:hypothetical protein